MTDQSSLAVINSSDKIKIVVKVAEWQDTTGDGKVNSVALPDKQIFEHIIETDKIHEDHAYLTVGVENIIPESYVLKDGDQIDEAMLFIPHNRSPECGYEVKVYAHDWSDFDDPTSNMIKMPIFKFDIECPTKAQFLILEVVKKETRKETDDRTNIS